MVRLTDGIPEPWGPTFACAFAVSQLAEERPYLTRCPCPTSTLLKRPCAMPPRIPEICSLIMRRPLLHRQLVARVRRTRTGYQTEALLSPAPANLSGLEQAPVAQAQGALRGLAGKLAKRE